MAEAFSSPKNLIQPLKIYDFGIIAIGDEGAWGEKRNLFGNRGF
jgi:hypothetical protein